MPHFLNFLRELCVHVGAVASADFIGHKNINQIGSINHHHLVGFVGETRYYIVLVFLLHGLINYSTYIIITDLKVTQ